MTITQRIELRRLGYSKEEIAELAEMEKAPALPETSEPAEPENVSHETLPDQIAIPEVVDAVPDVNTQLLTAITNLTAVLQSQKLNNTPQPSEVRKETPDEIFNNILMKG